MLVTDDDDLRAILELETIAVVGCSRQPGKPAHDVPRYLQEQGYEIIPVNPFADEILGKPAYESLERVEESIDLVDVFRPSEEVPVVVDHVLERLEACGDVEALWLQLGIRHDEAATRAAEAGLDVVQDRCLKVEHQRLMG